VALLLTKYLGLPFGGTIQVSFYMEWNCRKNRKAVGGLEEAIFVEGREVDVDQNYFVQFTHILFIFVSYSFGCRE
jgi:hypothetical protein